MAPGCLLSLKNSIRSSNVSIESILNCPLNFLYELTCVRPERTLVFGSSLLHQSKMDLLGPSNSIYFHLSSLKGFSSLCVDIYAEHQLAALVSLFFQIPYPRGTQFFSWSVSYFCFPYLLLFTTAFRFGGQINMPTITVLPSSLPLPVSLFSILCETQVSEPCDNTTFSSLFV